MGRLALSVAVVAAAASPELPRVHVDTTLVPPSGATVMVQAGASLQAALDAAQPGDAILLEPGAIYAGPFTLPVKPGSGWITLRPALSDDHLPPPGTRVDPSSASRMPKLESGSGAVVIAAPGAHHYRFIGLELRPRPDTFLYNLVTLGTTETSLAELPHHIIFDRCYLHGDRAKGTRRGIAMNSSHSAVVDSYLSDFKEAGADSQAVLGWNGVGPFAIVNNYLEAAGENVMFGGADPTISGLVPADIEVRQNHLAKPLEWKAGEPGYRGTSWTVKNLFELKNARRVLVDQNLLENDWVQAQNGFAVLFTVRNQDGSAPWSVVEDVTFTHNVVRHAANGVNVLGQDDLQPSQPSHRILIGNNLFDDIGAARWGGGGFLFQLLATAADVTIEHNTALQTGNILFAERGPHRGFVYRDNIAPHNQYGIIGNGTGPGKPTLAAYFPGAVVRKNVIAGGPPDLYPEDNFFPASLAQIGFVDLPAGDYRLAPNSPYKHAASDGQDPGADFQGLASDRTVGSIVHASASDEPPGGGSGPRTTWRRRGALRLIVGLALVVIAVAAAATASATRQRGGRHA
ncbi:MAG: hypothetical protein DMF80_22420 [Acidobacteria bacterium]|nr:MAG: hypothetical protein DMF80_22420 [Acidobacteriota bacterium]